MKRVNEPRDQYIRIRLSVSDREKLERDASASGRNLSEHIRELLRAALGHVPVVESVTCSPKAGLITFAPWGKPFAPKRKPLAPRARGPVRPPASGVNNV